MELVRAAALKGYFEVAEELKLDTVPLLRRAGFSPSMFANPEQMLPARSVIRLLEESAEAAGCPTFGLRMAERRELADLGIVSLLIAHQPTLGDALSVLSQYRNRINSTLVLRVEKFGDMVLLTEMFVARSANAFASGRRSRLSPFSTRSAAACLAPAGSRSASASDMNLLLRRNGKCISGSFHARSNSAPSSTES